MSTFSTIICIFLILSDCMTNWAFRHFSTFDVIIM